MTSREGAYAKAFIIFVFILLIGIFITIYVQYHTAPPAKAVNNTLPEALVPPAPLAPRTQESSVHSSKADRQLVLRSTPGPDGTTIYTFTVADLSGGNAHVILTKTLGPGATMSLPFNAWDPTDTYVFVGETTGTNPTYLVLRADGKPITDGAQYIDVGSVWTQKKIGYSIREATGWASGTLLIIYTTKDDGTHGPSFWFEIPDTAIMQLAR